MGWDWGHEGQGSLGEPRVLRWSSKLSQGVGTVGHSSYTLPSPSFSRASPKATSATMAQSLASVPHSGQQHCGAGSEQGMNGTKPGCHLCFPLGFFCHLGTSPQI